MGLQKMTEVQAETFNAAISGQDVLARARTGTGKTLAFLIPTVERITRNPIFLPGNSIGCLVIAPTRELAIQIGEEAEKLLAHHTELSVQVMYGGTKIARDMNSLNKRLPTILVTTPGRILEHLQDTRVRGRKFSDDIIAKTDILILDEVDRLIDMGFRKDIQRIISHMPRKEKRQTMLFSATIPTGLKQAMKDSIRDDYFEVDCVGDGMSSAPTNLRVTQSHVILPDLGCMMMHIYTILKQSTDTKPYKIIVFFPTARMVSFFADFLKDGFEYPIIELHSKKSQSSRNTASENFRKAKNAILFTSDLSSRGIDYPDVTQVIQIGLPESREQYIHRLGRTARAGKDGKGLLVLFPFESKFLFELQGLDIPIDKELSDTLCEVSQLELPEWMKDNFGTVNSKGNKLSTSAQLAYLSFIGYYIDQRNRIRAKSKADVVRISNDFSKAIGFFHVPSIPQQIATKMNLAGIPGIFIGEDKD
jgi:ATP-dependent RNA helicase MSS116